MLNHFESKHEIECIYETALQLEITPGMRESRLYRFFFYHRICHQKMLGRTFFDVEQILRNEVDQITSIGCVSEPAHDALLARPRKHNPAQYRTQPDSARHTLEHTNIFIHGSALQRLL